MDITATEFLKHATHTAEHFGFKNINTLKKDPLCKNCSNKLNHNTSANNRRTDALHGLLTSGLTTFCDSKFNEMEGPVSFYTIEQVPRSGEAAIAFHIFNVEKSIAEAILIQVSRALTLDLGHKNYTVRVNSLGDKESSVRYIRELTNYLKKRINDMPDAARELMKEHPITTLMHLLEKEHELGYKSPNPLEYLTDSSRKHFREIIEFLDMSETPYEIDPKLIGHHECYSDALFAIDLLDDEGKVLAHPPLTLRGGRYSEFVHHNTKQRIAAAGAVVMLHDKKAPSRTPNTKLKQPSIYVVQLGFGPKVRSLMLIDQLRKKGIHVHQNLSSDSLSSQLRDAEKRNVTHTIIIGQKEYVNNTVILRDMKERNQENISIDTLTAYLQKQRRKATA